MTKTTQSERALSQRLPGAVRKDAQSLAAAGADASMACACSVHDTVGGIGFRSGVDMSPIGARWSLPAGGDR